MRFLEKVHRFLYGRYITYGFDQLNVLLIICCCVIAFVNLFVRHHSLLLIQTALLAWMLARLLSKNIANRRRENDAVQRFFGRFLSSVKLKQKQYRDRQTHIYKTCPHCGVTLRLPRLPGEHNVNCPRCRNNFSVKVK